MVGPEYLYRNGGTPTYFIYYAVISKRNPEVLWNVINDIIQENDDFSLDLQLNFVGLISDNVLESIEKYNLSNYVNNVGYVSHKEAINYQKKSQLLLLIEIDSEDTKCIIPGKLFEYMASKRPIIAIGPEVSDIEKIINQTRSGTYFRYDEATPLRAQLAQHFEAYKTKRLFVDSIGLDMYSRKTLTQQLAQKLLSST